MQIDPSVKDIVSLVSPFAVLVLTWLVGQHFLVAWDLRKKRRETDISAASQFQQLYGEIKEVARLWRLVSKTDPPPVRPPSDIHWQLLARATAIEGRFEAVVMKLSAERVLTREDVQNLGLFRQACQDLRESIRDNRSLPAIRQYGGYLIFNELAAGIAQLLAVKSSRPFRV